MQPVNLLPPELRAGRGARRSLLYPMLFLILFSAFAGLYLNLDGQLVKQDDERIELQTAIAALEPVRVQREALNRLEAKLRVVVGEFERRTTWSAYADELASRLPSSVTIRDLRLDGQRVVMAASADSLSEVAQFISNLTASGMYSEPVVSQISVEPRRVDFQATVEIIRQKGAVPR